LTERRVQAAAGDNNLPQRPDNQLFLGSIDRSVEVEVSSRYDIGFAQLLTSMSTVFKNDQVDPGQQFVQIIVVGKGAPDVALASDLDKLGWNAVPRLQLALIKDPEALESFILEEVTLAPGQAKVLAVTTVGGKERRTGVHAGAKVKVSTLAFVAAWFEVILL